MPSENLWSVLLVDDWQSGGFGLYIHWPFCQAKCPYCDFNSHIVETIDQKRWLSAYLGQIERAGIQTGPRVLNTIFFGGGTPSLMDPEIVAAIIQKTRDTWPMVNDTEITLEANPTSVESGRFQGYRDAGVTRVSMGIQAMNDADLRRLGRLHSVAEARQAFDIARSTFDRVSFDLIYARQHQSLTDWQTELNEALTMAIDHLSLYQLTIEDGTAFGNRFAAGGLKGLPKDDLAADMYFTTQDICESAGLPAYEVSNHAKPGSESRHNQIYWRYGDYVGIGPGAHGRLSLNGQKWAIEEKRQPGAWLKSVETTNSGEIDRISIANADQASEFLMMGLRLAEGIDVNRYKSLAGIGLNPHKIAELTQMGMVQQDQMRLRATAQGRVVLNAVLRELLAE